MKKYTAGFSLIELMVTLAVVAILAAIAVPSFESLMNGSARRAQLSSIQGDLRFARSEALSKTRKVIVCTSTNGSTCTGGNNWDAGWIVYSDVNDNGAPDYGSNSCNFNEDCLLKSHTNTGTALTRISLRSSGSQLVFGVLGELSGGINSLVLCSQDANAGVDTEHSFTININTSGSIYTSKGAATCP